MTNKEVLDAIVHNSSIYEGIRELSANNIADLKVRNLVFDVQSSLEDVDENIEELEEYLEENLNG